MSRKFIVLALISLAVGITGAAAIVNWSKDMPSQHSQNLPITTKGLGEFGVTLEIPYGGKSPHHVLLLNNSNHHIIACQIVFEFATHKGEIYPARKVIAYSDLVNEQDSSKRKALLKAQPGIPPGTKWLIGMGYDPDLVPIKETITGSVWRWRRCGTPCFHFSQATVVGANSTTGGVFNGWMHPQRFCPITWRAT